MLISIHARTSSIRSLVTISRFFIPRSFRLMIILIRRCIEGLDNRGCLEKSEGQRSSRMAKSGQRLKYTDTTVPLTRSSHHATSGTQESPHRNAPELFSLCLDVEKAS